MTHRDFAVSPSAVDKAMGRLEIVNRERAAQGLEPLAADLTTQVTPDSTDPLMVHRTVTLRVTGADQATLDDLTLGRGVPSAPERAVGTFAVLEAACASVRLSGGSYVSREEGGAQSTPGQVNAYLADEPGGPLRTAMAPTPEDKSMAIRVRMWVRTRQPTSDYAQAVRRSVAENHMSMREVGTAASAVSGYLRHEQELAQAKRSRASAPGANGGSGASATPARPAAGPRGSRFLGKPGEKVYLVATLVSVEPVYSPNRRDPFWAHVMRTREGDTVRWTTGYAAGLRAGDVITLNCEVKAHETEGGVNHTVVMKGRAVRHTNAAQQSV